MARAATCRREIRSLRRTYLLGRAHERRRRLEAHSGQTVERSLKFRQGPSDGRGDEGRITIPGAGQSMTAVGSNCEVPASLRDVCYSPGTSPAGRRLEGH